MAAQALSSLADNALFIAAIALIQQLHGPDWMAPMMKWWFAAAYVLLAAFVGAISDSFPKGRVMFSTNALKVSGCLLMFCYAGFGLDPAQQVLLVCAAYGIVGIGAAAYSPAKYGILTELLPASQLVKANGWIEGLTIASIIQEESGFPEQDPKVSSVLHNRLNSPSFPLLQFNVTFEYIDKYVTPFVDGGTKYRDLYNTYVRKGLPAGPISNPGMSAINAALYPADTDYYYFVTDKDMNYYYASTYSEHLRNCKKAGVPTG